MPPTEVTFRPSPSCGLTTGHEANEWLPEMMYQHEEFEVETDQAGEPPLSFWSDTVRGVMGGVAIAPGGQYATLYSFTDQGIRVVKESPSRLRAAIEAAEGAGVKMLGVYYTAGPYDLVVIS